MNGKVELLDYIANLIILDDYLDRRGTQSDWLNREEKERFEELQKLVEEEQKKADEARKSEQQYDRTQAGTNPQRSITRRV